MIKRESKEAKKIFTEKYDENFVTPEVIEYLETDKFFVEISTGTALNSNFERETIYGVTVLDRDGLNRHILGKVFSDEKTARKYIEVLAEREGGASVITFLSRIKKLQHRLSFTGKEAEQHSDQRKTEMMITLGLVDDVVQEEMIVNISKNFALYLNKQVETFGISSFVYKRNSGDFWSFENLPDEAVDDLETHLPEVLEKIVGELEESVAEKTRKQLK